MEIRSGESSGFLVLHAFVDHALDLLIAEILEGLAFDTAQESLPDQFQKTLFLPPGGKRIALFGADLVDNLRSTAFGEILPVFRGEAFLGTVLDCVTNRAALAVGCLGIRIGDRELSGGIGVAGIADVVLVLCVVHLFDSFFLLVYWGIRFFRKEAARRMGLHPSVKRPEELNFVFNLKCCSITRLYTVWRNSRMI
ncbi:MAG TPA: hypothetical protein DER70_15370 [Lentisphaeria bacterium]|nr:hypothetical protein [Lentisphaeria bacterium]